MYRTLDSTKIIDTIDVLGRRIEARFPASGLTRVCAELAVLARESRERSRRLDRPNWTLRLAIGTTLVAGLAAMTVLVMLVLSSSKEASADIFGALQGIDSAFNILVLTGAALFFLTSLEARAKRAAALDDLHELRSIVHVIDMHQLTKDPSQMMPGATDTAMSPRRTLTPFELVRYLDYCSEMLSLAAKVSALYAQSSHDAVVIEAVSDLERLTASLSQKIWQKITLVEAASRADVALPKPIAPLSVQATAQPAVPTPPHPEPEAPPAEAGRGGDTIRRPSENR